MGSWVAVQWPAPGTDVVARVKATQKRWCPPNRLGRRIVMRENLVTSIDSQPVEFGILLDSCIIYLLAGSLMAPPVVFALASVRFCVARLIGCVEACR
jgi:hypothetical protein